MQTLIKTTKIDTIKRKLIIYTIIIENSSISIISIPDKTRKVKMKNINKLEPIDTTERHN